MIQAAKLASANRITAIMPWFPYSRQDKKSAPREPITAKLLADVLDAAGADRVLTMDLHAGQIQGFFRIPVDHMTALPLFARYYRETLGLHGEGVVAVSPDPGRAKMATKFAQMLDADFALMNKQRPAHDVASVTEVVGDVRGKVAIMSDDIIVTGGTLIAGRAGAPGGRRDQGLRVRDARALPRRRAHEAGRVRAGRPRGHRHGADLGAEPPRQAERADDLRDPRRDDRERLRRRVRLGDLRRREPALLAALGKQRRAAL